MSRSSRLEIGTNQSQYPGWNRPSSEFVIAPGGSWFNRYSKRRREEKEKEKRREKKRAREREREREEEREGLQKSTGLVVAAVTCASGLSSVLLLPLLGQHKKKRDLKECVSTYNSINCEKSAAP